MKQREWNWKQRESAVENPATLPALIGALQEETGLSALTLRVCVQRGLHSAQLIHEFLSPKFENLCHPFSIRDMDRAVERLMRAKTSGDHVRIYGDYDVDGTTGTALLSWIFRDFGFKYDARQPDRFKDGYGLNPQAVEDAVTQGVKILVTVDCGITSFLAAEKARELGLDLIVVDHHQIDPVKGLPFALAVVNPQRADCGSGLKQLCGCGLAFYLAVALRMRGREAGWFVGRAEPNLKQHLDLVVMATAADMVALVGDNHILVKYGLEVLKKTTKPGVKALLKAAGLGTRDISPSHLGFVLGPRINASGRMQSASLALELLTTTDVPRAEELALELERLNQDRAHIQNQIWDEVRVRVEQGIAAGKYRFGIAVADPGWHEGVVGIVASRVTETFHKPAAVIALREDHGKGSVRSFGGKDVLAALRTCAPYLLGFGGHRHAAGLSVALDQFDAFADAFDQALETITEENNAGSLYIEGDCELRELNVKSLEELEKLGPFGPGNPEPVFTFRASVKSHRVLKGRHLKLNLGPRESAPAQIEAIWFNGAERKDVEVDTISSSNEEREWGRRAGVKSLPGTNEAKFSGQRLAKDWSTN